jgi:hypothetical protein
VKKANISSNNTSISNPAVVIYPTEKTTDTLDTITLEIKYNCHATNKGIVTITLEITPDHCAPFKLSWQKICKEKGN